MDAFSNKPRSRRSIPSLSELHITPLTTEALISSPAIEDEEDHMMASHGSYITSRSLPQTPSILSRSPSRTRSRSRGHRRNAKSMLTLTSLDDVNVAAAAASGGLAPPGPYTPGPYGPGGSKRGGSKSAWASGRVTPGRVRVVDRDRTDFLLRTASLLVENTNESKGQGWISKRNSSTSLAAHNYPGSVGGGAGAASEWDEWRAERESAWAADDEYSPAWSRADLLTGLASSRRASVKGSASVPSSRWASRRGSRAGATGRPSGLETPRSGYFDNMSVEFADEGMWEESSEDEEIDEGELRRLLRGRVGGFFEDMFGGWLDFRGEDDSTPLDDGDDEDDDKASGDKIEAAKKAQDAAIAAAAKKLKFAGVRKEDIVNVKPPADTGGALADVRWLVGLARRALI